MFSKISYIINYTTNYHITKAHFGEKSSERVFYKSQICQKMTDNTLYI